jgi:hypothetical protein
MYAIICDARKGRNLGINTLALVDRGKTKKLWWTSDNPDLILGFHKKSAAEFALSRLKMNNPRIASLNEAKTEIASQRKAINEAMDCLEEDTAHMENELGWEGHKS